MSDDPVPSDVNLIWADEDLDGCETYEPSAFFAAIRTADTWRNTEGPVAPDGPGIPDGPFIPEKTGDTTRLVELLVIRLEQSRSDNKVTMEREEFALLVDLLWRHNLNSKSGKQRVPIYRKSSWNDLQLEFAAEYVRAYQSKGLAFENAIDRVVDEDEWIGAGKKESLILYMNGRLHRERRHSGLNAETLIGRFKTWLRSNQRSFTRAAAGSLVQARKPGSVKPKNATK